MDKACQSLINLDYGLFPKASNHEDTAEVGWLFYSTQQQDEEHVSDLISRLVGERGGAKWRLIRTNERYRKASEDNGPKTYVIHLEASSNRAMAIRHKLGAWYGSSSKTFPVGMKVRLVPPYQTILSYGHKTKYALLVDRQAALSPRRSLWPSPHKSFHPPRYFTRLIGPGTLKMASH